MLAYRDPFRTIEQIFEPDTEFIYWNNRTDLEVPPLPALALTRGFLLFVRLGRGASSS